MVSFSRAAYASTAGLVTCGLVFMWLNSETPVPILAPPPNPANNIFTSEALRAYNGRRAKINGETVTKPIYLAVLGDVFDVSEGTRYYARGGSYQHFVGRDASRSFVTGDSADSKLTDSIAELSDDDLEAVGDWYKFYKEHEVYKWVGRVVGRYFDVKGEQLEKFPWERLEALERSRQERKRRFPDCNSRWSAAEGSEVWCTVKSGGEQSTETHPVKAKHSSEGVFQPAGGRIHLMISFLYARPILVHHRSCILAVPLSGVQRSWAGVPRLYKEAVDPESMGAKLAAANPANLLGGGAGEERQHSERCVCVKLPSEEEAKRTAAYLRPYPECGDASDRCTVGKPPKVVKDDQGGVEPLKAEL